jgi:hypothetical protein
VIDVVLDHGMQVDQLRFQRLELSAQRRDGLLE